MRYTMPLRNVLNNTQRTKAGLAAVASIALLGPATPPEVNFPTGYRLWTHVKTGLARLPGHEDFRGMHNIYANNHALRGYRDGKFPDGSVLIFDLLEAKVGPDGIQPGPRRVLDVMRKDARRYAATGGWGYEEFRGDSRTDRLTATSRSTTDCVSCHRQRSTADYVFSTFTEHNR